jgi:hypothetical protein
MEEKYVSKIAAELKISSKQVAAVGLLLSENATVPFIARYRKEATGSLDEVAITSIRDRLEQLAELDKRREAILDSLEKQGKLTPELKDKVSAAETMAIRTGRFALRLLGWIHYLYVKINPKLLIDRLNYIIHSLGTDHARGNLIGVDLDFSLQLRPLEKCFRYRHIQFENNFT